MPAPEATAREPIDAQLRVVGWAVQAFIALNLSDSDIQKQPSSAA